MRQRTVVIAALIAASIPAFNAAAQDPATNRRAAQEARQANAYAEKFFLKLADDTAYAKSWTGAVSKRDWAAAAKLIATGTGAPVTSVTVTHTPGGAGDFAAAVPAAESPSGPWLTTADETAVTSADTLSFCFNLVIVKVCYIKTLQ